MPPSFKLDPKLLPLPRHSMYGMFIYMYSLNYPNEGKNRGKQTIHGVFGLMSLPFFFGFFAGTPVPRNLDYICRCGWDGVRSGVGTWMITCVWLITSLETFDDEIFGDFFFMFF